MEKIKILKIEEGKAPFVKEIANELKDCQAEVGGLIDCVCFEDGCLAVVNDEGKINGMKPNRRNGNDIICGPFFICGSNREGDFTYYRFKRHLLYLYCGRKEKIIYIFKIKK